MYRPKPDSEVPGPSWALRAARATSTALGRLERAARRVRDVTDGPLLREELKAAQLAWRHHLERLGAAPVALHLACGDKNLRGWFNVDTSGQPDLIWNLERGLPFVESASVQFVYQEHFLEHLDRGQALQLLQECRRVLTPGGVMRVAVPDLDLVLASYQRGETLVGEPYESEARALYGPVALHTRGEALDISFRAWGHRYLYNAEDLLALLEHAGFAGHRVQYRQSQHPFLAGIETRPADQSSLVVEVTAGADR